MQISDPIQKITQVIVIVIFLVGSTAVVLQSYSHAYDDLPSFYWATQLAFHDKVSAYQPLYFQQLGQLLERKIYPFLYPPPSILIFSPFLLGDYEQTKTVFTVFNLVLWWLLTWMMYKLYGFYTDVKTHRIASLLIPLWSLSFIPMLDTFRTGQINLFVLICVMPLFFQSSCYYRQLLSGVLFAIAIMLKVYLLLVLPVLMIMGQRRELVSTFATLMLLCAMSVWLLPWNLWPDWLALSRDSGAYGKQLPNMLTIPWNQSINGFFIRQFLDERILSGSTYWPVLIYACSAAVLIATYYTISKGLRYCAHGSSIAIALIFLMTTLVAPLTWLHHFVFAMPAIICCFALLSKLEETRYTTVMAMCTLMAAIFIGFPSLINMIFPSLAALKIVNKVLPLNANLVMSTQLLAGIGFWVLFLVLVWRKPRQLKPVLTI